jgi:voltage-gated hydrogen channel 1
VDVLLRGPVEEAGSLIVVGRLWRVFKIIEEFSSGAEDEIAELQDRIEELEKEFENAKKENQQLRIQIDRKGAPD